MSSYDTWPWLAGCRDMLFCFPCLLYDVDHTSKWTTGFQSIVRIKDSCIKHGQSKRHVDHSMSLRLLNSPLLMRTKMLTEEEIVSHNRKVVQNRTAIRSILQCVFFCVHHNLPIEGDKDSVFSGVVDLLSESRPMLERYLNKEMARGFMSKDSLKDLLDCCFTFYQTEIRRQIKEAMFISLLTEVITETMQITIVFRYLQKNVIREYFWGVFKLESTDATGILTVILNELQKVIPDEGKKLMGYTLEGDSITSGVKKTVDLELRKDYPNVHLVHYYDSKLNSILKSSSDSKEISQFFTRMNVISNYLSGKTNKLKMWQNFMESKFPGSSTTEWDFNLRGVALVRENYDSIVEWLKELEDKGREMETLEASSLLYRLQSDSFVFWLKFFYSVVTHLLVLFNLLQSTQSDSSQASSFLSHFQQQLQGIKGEYGNSVTSEERAKVVCDVIESISDDVTFQLQFNGFLIETLFNATKFVAFDIIFPIYAFEKAIKTYPMLDRTLLKTELEVLYSRTEFRRLVSLSDILKVLTVLDLQGDLREINTLIMILLTIPMNTVDPKRKLYALERSKMEPEKQEWDYNQDAVQAIKSNKSFFDDSGKQERIVDLFANGKRMKLIMKE